MSAAVYGHAVRQVVRATLIVSVGAAAFCYLVLLSSSLFIQDFAGPGGQVPEFFRTPPKAIEAFLGGSADFFSAEGWLSAALLHPVILSLQTVGAVMVASGAVAAELERGSLDLVLTRPVGRGPFLMGKALASLTTVTAVHAGALAGALLARVWVDGVDAIPVGSMLTTFAGSWALFSALSMIALLISTRSSLRGRSVGAAVAVVVGSFFLNFMALLFDDIAGLRYASPFHYFRPADILSGDPYLPDLLVLVALGAVSLLGALWWFGRRDLTR
ncbi:MAG TPA: ABC transporter permease subunit [Actinomycetota bacterium]|jgi:ABC-2 type transport system permease protein